MDACISGFLKWACSTHVEEEVLTGTSKKVIESRVKKRLSALEDAKSEEHGEEKRKSSFSFIKLCWKKHASKQETSSVPSNGSASTTLVKNSNKTEVPPFGLSDPISSDSVSLTEGACPIKAQKSPANVAVPASARSHATIEFSTPKVQVKPEKGVPPSNSSRNVAAKSKSNLVKQPSVLKSSQAKTSTVEDSKTKKQNNVAKYESAANRAIAALIAPKYQAAERQKLDDGGSRQILNLKARVLPHKSSLGLTSGVDVPSLSVKGYHEEKIAQKEVAPFVSTAEMVNKFQSRIRDLTLDLFQYMPLSQEDTASMILRRPKLTLTRAKEPKLGTAQRVHAVRIKSSAELKEEMLAKIPKFKAQPLNRKTPTLLSSQRTAPQPPQFHEFHFKTIERAKQRSETSSKVSATSTSTLDKSFKLTEPKPPRLETSLRARPPKIKCFEELELEELEMVPKFKARPLNKKILESKGDNGLFMNHKAQITTDDRLGPAAAVEKLFDKERRKEKERQLVEHISQKQLEEEIARIPKANPYPYTTDCPVIPPKPEPKHCTKPKSFQLESLVRQDKDMQRKLESKQRMEREAQRRIFRAQPIMKEDPIPLPLRNRRPLTKVQEFTLHGPRAFERSNFDKKIKEKELTYKRMREDRERAKMGAPLRNLGNTCFMNAVLQCLTHTIPFVGKIINSKQSSCCCGEQGKFCPFSALKHHIQRCLLPSERYLSPRDIAQNISKISPGLQLGRQEDAHEFFLSLLETVHTCSHDCTTKDCRCTLDEDSIVKQVFGGRLKSQLQCSSCGHCSDIYEPLLDLSLDIGNANDIIDALISFTKVEKMGDDVKLTCDGCKGQVTKEKRLKLDQAPEVLALHLKRFENNGHSSNKISKYVEYPLELDLSQFHTCPPEEVQLKYDLYAVVVHSGSSSSSGHYFSIIRSPESSWYLMDDERLTKLSERKALDQEAYILFYRRKAMEAGPSTSKAMPEKCKTTVNYNQTSSISPTTDASSVHRPRGLKSMSISILKHGENKNGNCEDR